MGVALHALQMFDQARVGRQQDRDAAQGIRDQSELHRQASARIQQTIAQQGLSNPSGDQASALAQYLAQLQRTNAPATAGLNQIGGVSNRYAADAEAGKQGIANYGNQQADIFSRLDAPMLQRQREGIEFGRLGADVNRIGSRSASQQYLTNMAIRGRRTNPWLDGLTAASDGFERGTAKAASMFGGG